MSDDYVFNIILDKWYVGQPPNFGDKTRVNNGLLVSSSVLENDSCNMITHPCFTLGDNFINPFL